MEVIHISAECFPAAKAGGLGDVVGALPKYLNQAGLNTAVIIPKYNQKWILKQTFKEVFTGVMRLHHGTVAFSIQECISANLGFTFYVANIPGKFDREGIYIDQSSMHPYWDEVERYICFQQAALIWLKQFATPVKVIHCHDHHTGLIPFMVKHCPEYKSLAHIPTIFTIHNGNYQGAFSWDKMHLLPFYDANAIGFLDWYGVINPMATAIKTAWAVTTVSPSYMEEMRFSSLGLESLVRAEWGKCQGIINGIDAEFWNPATDKMIAANFDGKDVESYKNQNKQKLTQLFKLKGDKPLFSFIGRLVNEKGADILPDVISSFIFSGIEAEFILMGTGEPTLQNQFNQMASYFPKIASAMIYDETLAHQVYAGSDFLMMPSRIEPCGLNQMYAFRYGTVPVVRAVGGLKDTVIDIGNENGSGIRFNQFSVEDMLNALYRANELYYHSIFKEVRKRIIHLDFSWEKSCSDYIKMYKIIAKI
jgi:starch synthase